MSIKTILVADDESHILHVVSLKLTNAGYRVLTAHDGQEDLEIAQQEKPDLLIADYHMPQLSGLASSSSRTRRRPTSRRSCSQPAAITWRRPTPSGAACS